MKKGVTVIMVRSKLKLARSKLKGALEDVDALLVEVNDVKMVSLVRAVGALRTIANSHEAAPDHACFSRGVARKALTDIGVAWTKGRETRDGQHS